MLPLHPRLVHFPLALAALMPLVSIGAYWAWRARRAGRRVFWVAAAFQLLLVASGFLALDAGEDDEKRVLRAIPEAVVEAHAEAAEAFLWTATGVLVVFLAAAFLRREPAAQALAGLACLGTLVVLGLAYRAGDAGGRLVYQHGAASVYAEAQPRVPGQAAATPAPAAATDEEHHDERH